MSYVDKLPRRKGSKYPPNLTHHARRQARNRGYTIDRLTTGEQDDWKAATGYTDHPPRWLVRDRMGRIRGYHYTLADVIKSLPEEVTPPTTNFLEEQ